MLNFLLSRHTLYQHPPSAPSRSHPSFLPALSPLPPPSPCPLLPHPPWSRSQSHLLTEHKNTLAPSFCNVRLNLNVTTRFSTLTRRRSASFYPNVREEWPNPGPPFDPVWSTPTSSPLLLQVPGPCSKRSSPNNLNLKTQLLQSSQG